MKFRYKPIVIRIAQTEDNIFNYDPDVECSSNIDYPRMEYGFHSFIEQARAKMDYVQKKDKKKLYLIMTDIERYIDRYKNNIGETSIEYFSLDKKPKILSRAFYKLWEILMCFPLINPIQKKFVTAHLAEGPGSFIQATMFYRELYGNKWKDDLYYGITLDPESDDKNVPPLEKQFTNYYDKEKPKRFYQHETYPKAIADKSDDKDNGDLTNPKTIKLFRKQVGIGKANFITGDGGFQWEGEETIQEQKAFNLIIGQIISAFKIQKKGGHFVCKFFETYTKSTMKAIAILIQCYNEVYFMKPLMSRTHNSEKYIVCLDFKYDENDKIYQRIDKKLDILLSNINNKPINLFINDIFIDYQLEEQMINSISQIAREISNRQFEVINEMENYVNEENYYGTIYQNARERQIDVTKFWIDMYFPPDNKYNDHKKICYEMKDESIKMQIDKLNVIVKQMNETL